MTGRKGDHGGMRSDSPEKKEGGAEKESFTSSAGRGEGEGKGGRYQFGNKRADNKSLRIPGPSRRRKGEKKRTLKRHSRRRGEKKFPAVPKGVDTGKGYSRGRKGKPACKDF